MSFVQISRKNPLPTTQAFLDIGFRPFFLSASLFAILTMALWTLIYTFNFNVPLNHLTPSQWHSHEMIYGYAMAVIAGFLLTAITNWTGIQTLHGDSLLVLLFSWVSARIFFLFGTTYLSLSMVFDLIFMLFLLYAVAAPIVKARQWKQIGILSKILLLTVLHIVFYLGAFGVFNNGAFYGIYGALYIIISLILVIGSRVVPSFIMNGVNGAVTISNPRWLSVSSLFFFVLFFVNELFIQNIFLTQISTCLLFIINSVRLWHWYTHHIWEKTLLWSLYLSFVFIDIGFLLFFLQTYLHFSVFIPLHAFAFGGIGIATLSMMTRVTLGHSGKSIHQVNTGTINGMRLLVGGALCRILLPLVSPQSYVVWIALSQALWICAFIFFAKDHFKILTCKDYEETLRKAPHQA